MSDRQETNGVRRRQRRGLEVDYVRYGTVQYIEDKQDGKGQGRGRRLGALGSG